MVVYILRGCNNSHCRCSCNCKKYDRMTKTNRDEGFSRINRDACSIPGALEIMIMMIPLLQCRLRLSIMICIGFLNNNIIIDFHNNKCVFFVLTLTFSIGAQPTLRVRIMSLIQWRCPNFYIKWARLTPNFFLVPMY